MLRKRLAEELVYLVQNALLLIPLAVLAGLTVTRDASLWTAALSLAPVLLSCAVSRLSLTLSGLLRLTGVLLGCSLLSAALTLWVLLSYNGPYPYLFSALSFCLSAAFFYAIRIGHPGLTYPKLAVGLSAHVVIAMVVFFGEGLDFVSLPMNLSGLALIAFGLMSINRLSLRHNIRPSKEEAGHMVYPGNLRKGNTLLMLGFLLVSVTVAWFGQIKALVIALIRGLINAYRALTALLGSLFSVGVTIPEENNVEVVPPMAEHVTPEWARILMIAFAIAIGATAAIFVLVQLIRILIKLLRRFRAFMKNFAERMRSPSGQDYTDETESIFSWEAVKLKSRGRIAAIKERFRRSERFEDQPDARAKVRFVYRRLLKLRLPARPDIVYKTPDELLSTPNLAPLSVETEQLERFIASYDLARYSAAEPGDSDVNAAQNVLSRL